MFLTLGLLIFCLTCGMPSEVAHINATSMIDTTDEDESLVLRLRNSILFPNYTAYMDADPAMMPLTQSEAVKYKAGVAERIVCSNLLICSASDRQQWHRRVLEAKRLREYHTANTSHPSNSALCLDVQSAAFLLEEDSEEWPMACLWTGSDGNGTCASAPPSVDPIYYVPPNEWGEKLAAFRRKIGCQKADVEAALHVSELYVCRERCTESGVGYLPSIIMAGSILVVLALLLGDQ